MRLGRRPRPAVHRPERPEGEPLLRVEGLRTGFPTPGGTLWAVDDVSFDLHPGATLGIVGESGSGKTVLSRSVIGLLPPVGVRREGRVVLAGRDLTAADPRALRRAWGADVAMVFQDPMTALNPVVKIGRQITEALWFNSGIRGPQAREIAVELLASMRIPDPARRLGEHPHQLSGGMRQRVCIAAALAAGPRLLIADEPTTALDVTVQAEILTLLAAQQRDRHMALVLITHDLGVVARRTDEIAVMYAGQVVEQAPTRALFAQPLAPYTQALLGSIPRLDRPGHARLAAIEGRPPDLLAPPAGCRFAPRCAHVRDRCHVEEPPLRATADGERRYRCWYPLSDSGRPVAIRPPVGARPDRPAADPPPPPGPVPVGRTPAPGAGARAPHLRDGALLSVEDLVVEYRTAGGGRVTAVAGVSIDVLEGETLGLVGESGCGKSTTGRAIVQLLAPARGTVRLAGQDLGTLDRAALRHLRPQVQMVFQDPISSLNPRHRVGAIVGEPLRVWGRGDAAERRSAVRRVLEAVGLDPDVALAKRPHELSGGQCQRISIARALVLEPRVVVCDESVSALDVSVQAQILNLLEDMKARFGLTLVFISHDLAVVRSISDRVAVMYLGTICEVGPPGELYARPAHHYTAALLAAIPVPDPEAPEPERVPLDGEVPTLADPPSGCRFRTRCPAATELCAAEQPMMREVAVGRFAACHHPRL